MIRIYSVIFIALAICSCKKTDYQKEFDNPVLFSEVVHRLNTVVMGNNFTPVVASRNYAYAAIAAYEVISAGDPKHYRSLCGQLNGFDAVAKPKEATKIDFRYAAILTYCIVGEDVTFPAGSMKGYIDSLHSLAIGHGMPDSILRESEEYARMVAKSVLHWSKSDNYSKTRTAPKFLVNKAEGRWVPTAPAFAEAVEPHWGEIRTMVMRDSKQYRVVPPPVFDVKDRNSTYCREVLYIKNTVDNLTTEQTQIADFWDDNPLKLNVAGHVSFVNKKFSPGGHWMSITGIAAREAKADFNTTVCAYAETSIALFDAFIESWTAKYTYNNARPETIIDLYFDPDWRPHLQTPPFPEYTCGHCTISAAAAKVLTSVFGDHMAYTDTSEVEFGLKSRRFTSFNQAAEETSWSRFYGGIHFHNSCIVSTRYGQTLGDSIVSKLKMKISRASD